MFYLSYSMGLRVDVVLYLSCSMGLTVVIVFYLSSSMSPELLHVSYSMALIVVAVLYSSYSTGLRVVAGPLTGKLPTTWFDSPVDHASLHMAIALLTSYRCCTSTGLTQCPVDCAQVLCGNKTDLLFH